MQCTRYKKLYSLFGGHQLDKLVESDCTFKGYGDRAVRYVGAERRALLGDDVHVRMSEFTRCEYTPREYEHGVRSDCKLNHSLGVELGGELLG